MKYSPWLPWTLCALSLTAAAAGALRAQGPESSYGDLKEVTLQGKLVSLQDELARKYGARSTGAREPQWALALPEGQYYTFFDNSEYRKLVEAKLQGKALEVKARHFPRSMLLEIQSFKEIDPAPLRRQYYCRVCDISASDFGPCVCCGKELELRKETP
ncbi:MAG: hypothetical protein ACK47B_06020 [Armatimonadota bacterium]